MSAHIIFSDLDKTNYLYILLIVWFFSQPPHQIDFVFVYTYISESKHDFSLLKLRSEMLQIDIMLHYRDN